MTGVLLRINEKLDILSPSERKIAKYIIEKPEEIVGLSISELANKVGTSKAGIMRFCKSIDFKGYRDFSIKFASEIAVSKNKENNENVEYIDLQLGDKLETIIRNVCLNNKKAIDDSYSILDYAEVEKAVECILKAKCINIFGVGASYVVAMDAQQKFLRINKYCTAYADSHLQMTAASNSTVGDVAIGISWSGETKDTVEASRVSKENGATLISITKYGKNHLAEIADIKLMLAAPEAFIRSGALSSRTTQMNMIDILYSCILSRDYHNFKKYLEQTLKSVKYKKY
ncbi:MAG: MurR/RpiR family transcriptional regulator [Clostridiaceae bacterium]|nr:MurR/RpiR family transcriptional regulator [Clostridiaceae bacterium]